MFSFPLFESRFFTYLTGNQKRRKRTLNATGRTVRLYTLLLTKQRNHHGESRERTCTYDSIVSYCGNVILVTLEFLPEMEEQQEEQQGFWR